MQVFKYELKKNRLSFLLWSLFFIFLIAAGMMKYEAFAADLQAAKVLLDAIPAVVYALVGISAVDLTTLGGYYSALAAYLALGVAIYAAMKGVDMMAKERSEHTQEFLFTKPKSRSQIVWEKGMALCLLITMLCTLSLLSSFIIVYGYTNELQFALLARFHFSFLLVGYWFGFVGMCIGLLIRDAVRAPQITMLLLSVHYVIGVVFEMKPSLLLGYLSIFKLYPAQALLDGSLAWQPVFLLLLLTILFYRYAIVRFLQQDLL
ncbi:MAG: ABC transporter permease subunit [Erysipelotrichaceae bacterium]